MLSRSQLVKYFKYEGTLRDGMNLADVVEKFPREARPGLLEVVMNASDEP